MEKKCFICNIDFTTYRNLSNHIKKHHCLEIKTYCLSFYNNKCKRCGKETKFKSVSHGFREFCSNKCSNITKSENKEFLEKLSVSQKGKPKKKHSLETKFKISEISKTFWKNNREKMLKIFRTDEFRQSQSEKSCNSNKRFYKEVYKGIRCDSSLEKKFIDYCLNNNIRIKRFEYLGNKSIKVNNKWYIPDFILDNVIVEVKDFHHWFRKELFSKLEKYKIIEKWSNENEFTYLLWFEELGFLKVNDLQNINNLEDLEYFINNYARQ